MKAELLTWTKEPVYTVATAARRCYSELGNVEMIEKISDLKYAEDLIRKVLASGHESVLEHVSFTFMIEGVSRVLTHQLVRHRIASYSQQSQRYVENSFGGKWYVVPESIAAKPEALKYYEEMMEAIAHGYKDLIAMGIPKEDARYVLANATETKIVVTMNARTLLHFFRLRCCNRAQAEIRAMADEMLKAVQGVAGVLFEKGGAPCQFGPCPEGVRSCGKPKNSSCFFPQKKLHEHDETGWQPE